MSATKVLEELGRAYDPGAVEQRWYRYWNDQGYFEPRGDGEPFVIVMPPPNVTGELHMGHALFVTVEDIMIRYQRMRGRRALWLPGSDHAGIAGQWVIERQIAKEGLTRHDLGREGFLERVWEWMDRYQMRIREQLTSLGASCDWSRYRFTMDPGPARAVRTVFKQLYDEGLIYRGERLISWCPRCNTALSDLEVIHRDVTGSIWELAYPVDGEDRQIVVATTRPETMLADTAVAVHPDDERYRDLVGRFVLLPIMNRRIPIIADEAVDPEFGTGALKVTPGHDHNDFEMGQRHGLDVLSVMNFDGTMNAMAGEFTGLTTTEARAQIVKWFEDHGLLRGVQPYTHSVGTCERCETIVEPMISTQWFVNMKPLAEPAAEVARSGELRFVPDRFTGVYLNWMDNIQDWCISRQLWWGHRIPVWYCSDCNYEWASVEEEITTCEKCGSSAVEQDPDVLDTWFSSGLWPFSMLGWPDETDDLKQYYPGHVMETGHDIIFFWVARMVFFGLKFMGEKPFHTVYLHGIVRDANGDRMSKTKGNVLDPVEITDKYGTDALRFTLITASGPGTDLKLAEERVESNRNFANKIYNMTKFVLSALEDAQIQRDERGDVAEPDGDSLALVDRWIVTALHSTIDRVTRQIDAYQFHEAGRTLYEFLWSEFADWYVEAAKVRLRADEVDPAVPQTLAYVLERSLRLLHPFMPYVTEELWQRLPHLGDALIIAEWPAPGQRYDDAYEKFEAIKEATRLVRNARAEHNVDPGRAIAATVYPGTLLDAYEETQREFRFLSRIDDARFELRSGTPEPPAESAISIVASGASIFLPMAGLVDIAAERQRLERELENARQEVARATGMLNNEQFVSKAPDHVVQQQRDRLEEANNRVELLERRLDELAVES